MLSKTLLYLLPLLLLCACNRNKKLPETESATPYKNFRLSYITGGWGSSPGTLTFKAEGAKCFYDNDGDTASINLDTKTIDSIISLTSFGQSKLVSKLNPKTDNTGYHYLLVASDSGQVEYKLRQASDSTAIQIIDILNHSIRPNLQKLWLWDHVVL